MASTLSVVVNVTMKWVFTLQLAIFMLKMMATLRRIRKSEDMHVYNRPAYQVWRGQYRTQAYYSDDTRLWQNTKNLAKPHHRAYLPPRYPRACLPVPPVDLKDPTRWGKERELSSKTNINHKDVGDLITDEVVDWGDGNYEKQRIMAANWILPEVLVIIKFKDKLRVGIDFTRLK